MKKFSALFIISIMFFLGPAFCWTNFTELRLKDRAYNLQDPIKHYFDSNAIETTVYELSDCMNLFIQKGSLKKPETKKYFQSFWTFNDILSQKNEFKSSIELMKTLRQIDKRNKSYSIWKLISVENKDDIYFEKKTLDLGYQKKSHELFRAIKTGSDFCIICLKQKDSFFTEEEKESYLQALENLH